MEISDPKEVTLRAIKYFNDQNVEVYLSTRKDTKCILPGFLDEECPPKISSTWAFSF
jgi:hypothetical protein